MPTRGASGRFPALVEAPSAPNTSMKCITNLPICIKYLPICILNLPKCIKYLPVGVVDSL